MQFVAIYRLRDQSEESVGRVLSVFGAWTPPDGYEIASNLGFADGSGGILIVEADSAEAIAKASAVFTPFMDFEVHPVVDVSVTVAAAGEAPEAREVTAPTLESPVQEQTLSALLNLGYSRSQAERALSAARETIGESPTLEDLVRGSLKNLVKR